MVIPPWTRPGYVAGGAPARVLLFVFGDAPLAERLQLSRSRHGVPEGGPAPEVSITTTTTAEEPEWFAGFTDGASRVMAEAALGADLPWLLGATICHRIEAEIAEPSDLGYLQSAWALARCVCEASPRSVVLDAYAARWLRGSEALGWAPERAFDLAREVTFIFETDETPGLGHLAHTRGLAKFGRPDVVLPGVAEDRQEAAGAVLWALADLLARGARLAPGDVLEGEDGGRLSILPYQPGELMPDLYLNNDAVLVVDR